MVCFLTKHYKAIPVADLRYTVHSNTCLDGVEKLIMADPVSHNLCATDVARAHLGSSPKENESKFKN